MKENAQRVKKLMLLFALLLGALQGVVAQDNTRNVSVEIFGAHNLIGVNYDARLKGNSGWGYRVGIGYGFSSSYGLFDEKLSDIAVPLELNYLLGRKNSKLELGFGASLGWYHTKSDVWTVAPGDSQQWETCTVTDNRFGYFLFGNIGYRIQRPHGFVFRIGVTPSFNFGDDYGVSRSTFFPYIGFGKSF